MLTNSVTLNLFQGLKAIKKQMLNPPEADSMTRFAGFR